MREIRFLLNLRWLCSYRPAWIHNYKTCCCTVGITLECANNKNKPFSLYWWGHSGHTHIDRDTPRCFPSTCESTGEASFLHFYALSPQILSLVHMTISCPIEITLSTSLVFLCACRRASLSRPRTGMLARSAAPRPGGEAIRGPISAPPQ